MKSFLEDNEFVNKRISELGIYSIFAICNKINKEKEELLIAKTNWEKISWEELYNIVIKKHFSIWEYL